MNDFHADESREYEELWNKAEAKVEKLETEIERLKKDKRRLDWMETHSYVEVTSDTEHTSVIGRTGLIWRAFADGDLRDAIDAEIGGEDG